MKRTGRRNVLSQVHRLHVIETDWVKDGLHGSLVEHDKDSFCDAEDSMRTLIVVVDLTVDAEHILAHSCLFDIKLKLIIIEAILELLQSILDGLMVNAILAAKLGDIISGVASLTWILFVNFIKPLVKNCLHIFILGLLVNRANHLNCILSNAVLKSR